MHATREGARVMGGIRRQEDSTMRQAFRYSLRSLFLIMMLAAAYFAGWISHRAWNRRNTEQAIIDALRQVEGPVRVENAGDSDVIMLKGRKSDVEATEEAIGKIQAAVQQ
jgi:hypothetical protein